VVAVDDHLLVLNKPCGLLAVPGRGPENADCLSARAQAVWPDALVVHRLDMATSGLMVMARGPDAQRTLSEAFAKRLTHKRYEAVVAGHVDDTAHPRNADGWHTTDLPLVVDWPNRPRSIVCHTLGKPSLTRWRVIEHGVQGQHSGGHTRLALEPVTGRSHQLRVHLLALGHPILGDMLYAPAAAQAQALRLLLHATRLCLPHPVTGQTVEWHSPAPF
jgi:tRNA pseudouridine32 synthase/23S rRNA pseudouridine746 synthase